MTPELQAFATRDIGFQQFCDRYETVSADPETRREYVVWFDEALREEGILDWTHLEEKKQIARNMKRKGMSIDDIVEMTGLSFDEAEEA